MDARQGREPLHRTDLLAYLSIDVMFYLICIITIN